MNLVISTLQLPVRLRPKTPMNDEELLQFSRANRPLRMEREENGDILVMTPTGIRTGNKNLRIGRFLDEWAEQDGRGIGCDSSTGFKLKSGAVRSPDAAWIANQRLNTLTDSEQEGFGPLCPNFVIELLSPSDRLTRSRKKIAEEWIENGVEVAWLIDVKSRRVTIYRPGEALEILTDPSSVQGTGPVRGFELVMSRVWG